MRALIHNLLLYTRQPVEDDGSSATLNIVDGGLGERSSDGERDGVFVQRLENLSHLEGWYLYYELGIVRFEMELQFWSCVEALNGCLYIFGTSR